MRAGLVALLGDGGPRGELLGDPLRRGPDDRLSFRRHTSHAPWNASGRGRNFASACLRMNV